MTHLEFTQVNLSAGRPRIGWTDEKWQEYFKIMKLKSPHIGDPAYRKLRRQPYRPKEGETYTGETNYTSYCSFINDVLYNIRLGNLDYCYYIYQISELIRFHPNLKSRYIPDNLAPHFEVWL